MDKISFFSADYRDGRVHIGSKSYPAGTFAAHLLTQYYIAPCKSILNAFVYEI